jgi:hypothetical protein
MFIQEYSSVRIASYPISQSLWIEGVGHYLFTEARWKRVFVKLLKANGQDVSVAFTELQKMYDADKHYTLETVIPGGPELKHLKGWETLEEIPKESEEELVSKEEVEALASHFSKGRKPRPKRGKASLSTRKMEDKAAALEKEPSISTPLPTPAFSEEETYSSTLEALYQLYDWSIEEEGWNSGRYRFTEESLVLWDILSEFSITWKDVPMFIEYLILSGEAKYCISLEAPMYCTPIRLLGEAVESKYGKNWFSFFLDYEEGLGRKLAYMLTLSNEDKIYNILTKYDVYLALEDIIDNLYVLEILGDFFLGKELPEFISNQEVVHIISSGINEFKDMGSYYDYYVSINKRITRAILRPSRLGYFPVEIKPSWCSELAWKVYQDNKLWKGAKIILDIQTELIKKYSPTEYFYVCMARDAVPLYVSLFESGYECMLGIFSRAQIGDSYSIEVLRQEVESCIEATHKKPVLLDVQGRGTIYDHLKEEGLDWDMVFGVSSNLDSCRYPVLIEDENMGKKAIRYVEKLPQSNGRAEGFYQKDFLYGSDNLVNWGTRDPNFKGAELGLSDHDILCVRGVFYQCMGISPIHAGMIGMNFIQRVYGITKFSISNLLPTQTMGIAFNGDIHDSIKERGFLTQFETGTSGGGLSTACRRDWEEEVFCRTGIRPVYGAIQETFFIEDNNYGDTVAILDIEKLYPYTSFSNQDSLGVSTERLDFLASFKEEVLENYISYVELQFHTLMVYEEVVKEVVYAD